MVIQISVRTSFFTGKGYRCSSGLPPGDEIFVLEDTSRRSGRCIHCQRNLKGVAHCDSEFDLALKLTPSLWWQMKCFSLRQILPRLDDKKIDDFHNFGRIQQWLRGRGV